MARRRNGAHHDDLLLAATQLIATQGLGVATSSIASRAGVSAGTLFNHFPSKTALLNELFVALKCELGRKATHALPADATPRDQLHDTWQRWVGWATLTPEKFRALAQLDLADDITAESRETVHAAFVDIADLLERCRDSGPMREVPLSFVLQILTAIADATIDDLIARPGSVPASHDPRTSTAFGAIWRAIAG